MKIFDLFQALEIVFSTQIASDIPLYINSFMHENKGMSDNKLKRQIFNDYIGHIQKACQQTVYALF